MRIPGKWKESLLLTVLALYTAFSTGPFIWVGMMSLRTTSEISANPYGLPEHFHWDKFVTAWTTSNYGIYFWNSTAVVVTAVFRSQGICAFIRASRSSKPMSLAALVSTNPPLILLRWQNCSSSAGVSVGLPRSTRAGTRIFGHSASSWPSQ